MSPFVSIFNSAKEYAENRKKAELLYSEYSPSIDAASFNPEASRFDIARWFICHLNSKANYILLRDLIQGH